MSEEEISTVLNTYMYLDYREADDGMSIDEIVKELASSPDCCPGGIHYGEYMILSQAAENPEIGSLIIDNQSHFMGFDNGTAACSFQTPDQSCTYIVYRGTVDGEWPDNGIGMTESSTVQQERALSYFDAVIERSDIGREQRLVVTGHSKGGNKAQYVLMSSENGDLADVCYSIDGQGFSENAIETWKARYGEEEYEKRRSKIVGVYGENDYVNVLGHSIVQKENIYYIKTPVEKTNFAGYHDIKYMFARQQVNPQTGQMETIFSGKRNAYALKRGDLGNYAARLSADVMNLPEHRRDGCAAVIMHLMEVTRGGKEGINGEKLSLLDVDDFLSDGPELISDSLFFSGAGLGLLWGVFQKPTLACGMQGDVCLVLNKEKLKQRAEELRQLAVLIQKEMEAVSLTQEKLSAAMKGGFDMKHKLTALEREMKKLKLSFEYSSKQLIEITQMYTGCDETVFNS